LEILPGIHTIPGVKLSKAYLIEGETLALVDAGLPWHGRTVLRYIASIGRKPEELSHILVTHSHPDHTGGIYRVAKKTGAAVVAHGDDTRSRRGGGSTLGYMGIFGALPVPMPFLGRMPIVTPVQDGELLSIGGGIRVIHTPGHTDGSVCFLDESTKTLFSGDTIFSDGTRISRSVPFFGYDDQAYRNSLKRLAGMDFDAVCGGHGSPLLDGGAGILGELLDARPDPPTWGRFLMSMPRRLRRSLPLTGEDP
jgi:glyoxylase-like metal-dependent hydrolase (beta-lactamase superfamily II)|tara:strand:- start:1076 stop:1831 length:756 start_codon:yes stop_codon:yes gene_type:complete